MQTCHIVVNHRPRIPAVPGRSHMAGLDLQEYRILLHKLLTPTLLRVHLTDVKWLHRTPAERCTLPYGEGLRFSAFYHRVTQKSTQRRVCGTLGRTLCINTPDRGSSPSNNTFRRSNNPAYETWLSPTPMKIQDVYRTIIGETVI